MRWMARGERPTEPGWYWIQSGGKRIGYVEIVDGVASEWVEDDYEGDHYAPVNVMASARFAGPIPEPESD